MAAWATRVGREFKTLESSLSKRGSVSCELSKNLRDEVKEAAECIDALFSVAKKINGARGCCTGSKPARLLKSQMFKAKFVAAQIAVERARVELDRTLTIKIADTVNRIEETADANSHKLDKNEIKVLATQYLIQIKNWRHLFMMKAIYQDRHLYR